MSLKVIYLGVSEKRTIQNTVHIAPILWASCEVPWLHFAADIGVASLLKFAWRSPKKT